MSIFKKCAAAAIWTTTATAYVGVGLVKTAAKSAARAIEQGKFTPSNGRTAGDYYDYADKCGSYQDNDKGILHAGFQKAKDLWNDPF